MHLSFRPSAVEWAQKQGWANQSHQESWYRFVGRATPRQLQLFGFPPPRHPYWTPSILRGMALRYPNLDLGPWRV